MKVQKFIEVRLTKKRMTPIIDAVQYDTGVQIVFSLVDFDIPSSTSATLYVQKRSGKFVYQEKNITISGNDITVNLENQALTEHGEMKYQIKLKNGTDTITTFTGILRIEKSLADANAVESKTVISAFDELTADKLAEFRAEAEVIAQNVIATIPDDYATMEAKVNELANSIKGNLSGAVVFADDVSPVEHNPVVKVHGKNLAPFGTITFTRNKSILLDNPLPEGTYTISVQITSNDTDSEYSSVSINNKSEVMKYIALKRGTRVSATFTVTKPITNIDFCAAYNYNQGETDSATWADIQIEEGMYATEYEPYIDPSTVTVGRHGKNLAYGSTSQTYTSKGLTITRVEGSSEFVLNGTTEATFSYVPTKRITLPPGTYTVSVYGLNTVSTNVDRCFAYDATNSKVLVNSIMTDKPKSFTLDSCVEVWIEVVFAEGTVYSNKTIKLQMEYGSEATEYEKCKEVANFVPTADGTVSGLTSVSPNMTILTDTEGAIVECEYNRDTNKVIEKITNEISALGGTGGGAVSDEQIAKAVTDYIVKNPISVPSAVTVGVVELFANKWVGGENLYSQVVSIAGVTPNSQVDLTPSVEQLVIFYEKDLTFVTENEDGVVTVYAIGQKPENDYAIQVTITEVV